MAAGVREPIRDERLGRLLRSILIARAKSMAARESIDEGSG